MRYQGNNQPFLTPQMLAASSVLEGQQGRVEAVAAKFEEATHGRHQYTVTEVHYTDARLAGGPRAAIDYGVTGPYVFAMEFGSERMAFTNKTRGSLRGAFGKDVG